MKFNTDIIVEKVTIEEILKRTTEYDIYSYYIPNKFEIGKVISSPFRQDVHPSFGIFKSNKSGSLLFKDQATNQTGDCFKFVEIKFNLTFKEALDKIWNDIIANDLHITKKGIIIRDYYKNKKTIVSVKRKNFTKTDDDYWGQYHINRDTLKQYNVFPISRFWVNDYISSFEYSHDNPMYAYKIFNSFKVYRPYSKLKKDKWRSGCSVNDIQGWEQLPKKGKILVITKSLKDIMVLSQFKLPSIAPPGETTIIPQSVLNDLKKRFKRIVVLYDYDEAGLLGAKKMQTEYSLETIFIPKHYLDLYNIKDISDYIKEFGIDKTKALLKELL